MLDTVDDRHHLVSTTSCRPAVFTEQPAAAAPSASIPQAHYLSSQLSPRVSVGSTFSCSFHDFRPKRRQLLKKLWLLIFLGAEKYCKYLLLFYSQLYQKAQIGHRTVHVTKRHFEETWNSEFEVHGMQCHIQDFYDPQSCCSGGGCSLDRVPRVSGSSDGTKTKKFTPTWSL